jgi:hypothetical protein
VGAKEVKGYSDYCHRRMQEAESGSGNMLYWQGRWHAANDVWMAMMGVSTLPSADNKTEDGLNRR